MGILGGSDIDRIADAININFYIDDVITNGISGYVLPNDELFRAVFSRPEVYASYSVLNVIAGCIANPKISDASRLLFKQKALEFAGVWGEADFSCMFAVFKIFCGLGESLYSVKEKVNLSKYSTLGSTSNHFSASAFFPYLCGVISRQQWLRARQGYSGASPDMVYTAGDLAYVNETYVGSDNNNQYKIVDITGSGDTMSQITLYKFNGFAGYATVSELGDTWGKGSKMREISQNYVDSRFLNKNLLKQMISKKREYLSRMLSDSVVYRIDEEETKVYQPSAVELGLILDEPKSPASPQKPVVYFTPASNSNIQNRIFKDGSTTRTAASRDVNYSSSVGSSIFRVGVSDQGGCARASYPSSRFDIPIAFDLNLPEWCI